MHKFIFVFLFFVSTFCRAEELENKDKLYDDALCIMEVYSSLFHDPVLYANKIKKSSIEINLSELSKNENIMFFIYQGLEISDILFIINESWQKQCDNLKDDDPKKHKLIEVIEKIKYLRKKHAFKLEKFMENSFEQINEISNEEKHYLIKKTREWNDNQKLIERNVLE